jgi:CubicO group peptidase (beta-lactamase class C family)
MTQDLIRAAAEELLRHQPLPGGVVVAVDRDRTLFTLPFGHADPDRRTPTRDTHLFEIGSISKLLTSVLIGQLVDDGRLDLDDRTLDHLPWLSAGPHTGAITVGRLLAHTSGLISGSDAVPDAAAQVWTLRDRDAAPPGAHFHYSNVGYLVLGEIVRALTGEPHWTVLRRRVFVPLGMRDALARVTHADRPLLAVGSTPARDDRPWLPGDPLVPSTWLEVDGADGNVALDAAGLGTLLRLLLGDGAVDGHRVISAESWRRVTTATAPDGEDVVAPPGSLPVSLSRYGLGVNVERIAGADCVTHGGGMIGYGSFVLADRTNGVAVGALTNADGDCLAAQLLARFAHQVLIADAPPQLPDFDPAVRAGELADLAGLRGTDVAGEPVEVELGADGDRALVHAGGASGRIYRDPYARLATDHPALRLHWLYRPVEPSASSAEPRASAAQLPTLPGHYRAHTPWFANFRIVAREDRLWLTACRGVEAPTADQQLVPIDGDTFRIGAAPWLPERLTCRAVVDSRAVLLDLDGCGYSRTGTQ